MHSLLLCLLVAQAPTQTPAPEPTALVTGRVVDGVTKVPVSAAIVSIVSAGSTRRNALDSTLTDANGRYFFENVPSGRSLSITATKPGWLEGAFGRLRPEGERTNLDLKKEDRFANADLEMWRSSVLGGTVLDEAGEAVVDVLVWAVRRRIQAGRPQVELVTAVRTDDRGAFRLANLMPGNYSVLMPTMVSSGPMTFSGANAPLEWLQTMTGVGAAPMSVDRDNGVAAGDGRSVVTGMTELSAPPQGAPWMTFPPTFFGGSTTSPAFVKLEPGQDREGIALVARRVPTQSISGTLTVPGGSAASYALHLLPASIADYPLFDVATAVADASGAFTFYGIPAGNYLIRVVRVPAPKGPNLRASTASVDPNRKFVSMTVGGNPGAPPPPVDTEPLLFANQPVTVGEAPVRGLTIGLQQGVRITGRAVFTGTAPQPDPQSLPNLTVEALAANGFTPYMARQYNLGRFSADGTFTTPSLLPGQYVLYAATTTPWTVKSVTAAGADVTGLPIDAMSDVGDIVITYTDKPSTIRGNVNDQGGSDSRASVLMFSARPEHWVNYGDSSVRLRSVRTSATGAFSMAAPPPGDYLLIAMPEDQVSDWRDPANLAALAPRAQRLAVRDGESPTVNLTTVRIR